MREPSVVVAAGDGVDAAILVGVLRRHGFDVHVTSDGRPSAVTGHRKADVALVDTDLACGDPLALVRELREAGVPTAVVGGRRPEERADAEAHGADAYLVRPVVATHLLATLRSLAQRPAPDVVLRSGALTIDVGARAVRVGARRIHLAPREFDLLAYLASHPGRVFATPRLLRDVWHAPPGPQDAGTVAVHVRRLRQKLEAAGLPPAIRTVKGEGYTFAGP